MTINSVCRLPEGFGKAQLLRSDYVITVIESADPPTIREAIERLLAQSTVSVERKKKQLTLELPTQISNLELRGDEIHLSLAAHQSATLRPSDVLDLLGFADWIERGSLITRVRVVLQREFEETDDPTSAAFSQRPDAERPDAERPDAERPDAESNPNQPRREP